MFACVIVRIPRCFVGDWFPEDCFLCRKNAAKMVNLFDSLLFGVRCDLFVSGSNKLT